MSMVVSDGCMTIIILYEDLGPNIAGECVIEPGNPTGKWWGIKNGEKFTDNSNCYQCRAARFPMIDLSMVQRAIPKVPLLPFLLR